MKFEGTRTFGFLGAVVGMRLPMSKDYEDACSKSDTYKNTMGISTDNYVGDKDLKLMQKLIKEDKLGGGQPNSKFMRMIHCQVAITAPLCWWKEFDTYKIATTSNSTSTMHKIGNYPITEECFERNPLTDKSLPNIWIEHLEDLREEYNETKDKSVWYSLIYELNDSWLQTRMIDLDYATIRNMVIWRKNHKQQCWSGLDNPDMESFISWAKTLPYSNELLFN